MTSRHDPTSPGVSTDDDVEALIDPRVRPLSVSATLAARARAETLASEGRTIYRLGLGQSPFPVPAPIVESLRRNAHERDYLPVRGLPALRRAVARYHDRRFGFARSADDVVIGPGSKELMFLLQLCYSGDIVIPTPAWVSYAPQARLAGRSVRFVPTSEDDDLMLSPRTLDDLCRRDGPRARILVLNYPGNPVGATFSRDALAEIAAVCRRHGVIVLSDEIYGELHLAGEHVSIGTLYEEGTIVSTGLSKWCGAGGWRLGVLSFPARLRRLGDALAAAASETYSTTSAPIQHAAVAAFEGSPELGVYLADARRLLALLMPWSAAQLRWAGLRVTEPCGAFYLFPSFEPLRAELLRAGICTDRQIADRLLEQAGISCLPGSDFGMSPDSLYLRLALVDFDGASVMRAAREVALDESFVHERMEPVARAIGALCAWCRAL